VGLFALAAQVLIILGILDALWLFFAIVCKREIQILFAFLFLVILGIIGWWGWDTLQHIPPDAG
jgi:hypothetical protein